MDQHAEQLYKAFHQTPAAMRENLPVGLEHALKQRHANLNRRFAEQQASRKLSEPILKKIFHEAAGLKLPPPPKRTPPSLPAERPRSDKPWLKHGSVFIFDVPPFAGTFAAGSITGGGMEAPLALTDGQMQVLLSVPGDPPWEGGTNNNGGTASSTAAVGMAYSPPGLICKIENGVMTVTTSVSWSYEWSAGSKTWTPAEIDFSCGVLVQQFDSDGAFVGTIANQEAPILTGVYQNFLGTGGDGQSGMQTLIAFANVDNNHNYAIWVYLVGDALASGGWNELGFVESFVQGYMQASVPFIAMDIIYPV